MKTKKTLPKTEVRNLFKAMMIGDNARDTARSVADIVYYHYLDSRDGKRAWASEWEDDDEKVDHIFDSIYTKYTEEIGWMTEEEWRIVSEPIYNMVYEGVY